MAAKIVLHLRQLLRRQGAEGQQIGVLLVDVDHEFAAQLKHRRQIVDLDGEIHLLLGYLYGDAVGLQRDGIGAADHVLVAFEVAADALFHAGEQRQQPHCADHRQQGGEFPALGPHVCGEKTDKSGAEQQKEKPQRAVLPVGQGVVAGLAVIADGDLIGGFDLVHKMTSPAWGFGQRGISPAAAMRFNEAIVAGFQGKCNTFRTLRPQDAMHHPFLQKRRRTNETSGNLFLHTDPSGAVRLRGAIGRIGPAGGTACCV